MKFLSLCGLGVSLLLLHGCVLSPSMNAMQREAYLQQFIGKSSADIRAQLDLSRIGYQQVSPPVLSPSGLTYTAVRAISIPVPMAQNPALGMGAGTAVPVPGAAAQSYDVHLHCRISFRLERNIAKDVQLTGRTC